MFPALFWGFSICIIEFCHIIDSMQAPPAPSHIIISGTMMGGCCDASCRGRRKGSESWRGPGSQRSRHLKLALREAANQKAPECHMERGVPDKHVCGSFFLLSTLHLFLCRLLRSDLLGLSRRLSETLLNLRGSQRLANSQITITARDTYFSCLIPVRPHLTAPEGGPPNSSGQTKGHSGKCLFNCKSCSSVFYFSIWAGRAWEANADETWRE